jgi:2-C-methyl-D-erythritol 4-phosphate cytidylyltransferase
MHDDVSVILLAGGSGSRTGLDQPKQFSKIAGKSVLEHTHASIRKALPDALIYMVVPIDSVLSVREMFNDDRNVLVVSGGASRQESAFRAMSAMSDRPPRHVLIHDAARPFVDARILEDVLMALKSNDAVDVAIPTADTIIEVEDGYVKSIPKRSALMRGQTPQAFKYELLMSAYQSLGEEKLDRFTDDCGILLAYQPEARIRVVTGDEENFKITHPIDLTLADEMFRLRNDKISASTIGIDAANKRVLIFGGTAGIGKALADILSDAGAKVVSRSRSNGCDIGVESDVAQAIRAASEELGGLDWVVNAAGLLQKANLHDCSSEDVEKIIRINLTGATWIAKWAYDELKKTRGMLLQFSSSSYSRGRAHYVLYAATKAAIVNMTQGLSEEWAADGIRVNCIIPGRTDTRMRRENFAGESQKTLFSPYEVALSAAKLASSNGSGVLERMH